MESIKARPAAAKTKGELRRLRAAGCVPVSVQHKGEETAHFEMDVKPFQDFLRLHGESALLTLDVGGRPETVIFQNAQRDPVSRQYLHLTFQKVVRGEAIKAHVPLLFTGAPEAVKDHTAVLNEALDHLEVRCQPADLPDHITVDVSQLGLGDILRISDIPSQARMEILNPPDTVVASVVSLARGTQDVEATPQTTEESAETTAEGGDAQAA